MLQATGYPAEIADFLCLVVLGELESFRNTKASVLFFQKFQVQFNVEIFSHPQAKENYRQYLLLLTDILQKTVAGPP